MVYRIFVNRKTYSGSSFLIKALRIFKFSSFVMFNEKIDVLLTKPSYFGFSSFLIMEIRNLQLQINLKSFIKYFELVSKTLSSQ